MTNDPNTNPTMTHNPLQPYPPLPLSTDHSKKKKKQPQNPSGRNPPEKMSHCDVDVRRRMVFGSEERREQMEKQRRKREKRTEIMR